MAIIACKDCKFCQLRPTPTCFHSQSFVNITNYYTGTVTVLPQSDQAMRTIGTCGPNAVLFSPIVAGWVGLVNREPIDTPLEAKPLS
jgi:hypothetical protein